ncbi:MAG: glycosidase, partial [Syntrophomonadaceae bacterium]
GFDFWLVTRALAWNKALCEVNLGGIKRPRNLERRNRIFQETTASVFECIRRDSAVWLRDRLIIRVADIVSRSESYRPDKLYYPRAELLENLARIRTDYEEAAHHSLPPEVMRELNEALDLPAERFNLSDRLWVDCVRSLLLAYTFGPEEQRQGALDVLTALYNGRIAAYANQMTNHRRLTDGFPATEQDTMLLGKMESMRRSLTEECWRQKPHLNRQWLDHFETSKPPLVPMGYAEYVPGEPVVAPKKIIGLDKRVVSVDAVFKNLRCRYEDKFNQFIHEGLGLKREAGPAEHVAAVEDFMLQAEAVLAEILPGDLHTAEGLRRFLDGLYALLPAQQMYSIGSDILREAVMRFPPINLMVPLGYYKPADLIENTDVREVISYINLVESWSFVNRATEWIVDQIRPDKFEWVDLKPLVISDELPFGTASHSRISNLNRITARITTRTLAPQKGGRFPRLLYLTSVVRRMAIAEQFSRLTLQNVKERKDVGAKLRNVLMGLQQGDDFSAAVIYENVHHRLLAQNLRQMAHRLEERGSAKAGSVFHLLADGYGGSQVLGNGTFLTCTAWSWASYSNKGGRRNPPPLSTSVESRWFSHDFLEDLYQELGYDPAEIMKTVFHMMLAGKSTHNLLDRLLPARPKDVPVVIQEPTDEPSRTLQRYEGNPLLEPIASNMWEAKYVLNPGALRIGNRVYLFYRAVGDDDVSYIGLAVTDGYEVLERLPEPIFAPVIPEEKMGCEDP